MLSFSTSNPRSPPSPRRAHRRTNRRLDLQTRRAERNRADITRGLIALGILVIASCIGLFSWSRFTAREEAERAALHEQRLALHGELLDYDALNPEQARALLERIAATRSVWEAAAFAPAIAERESQARRVVEAAEASRALAADLEALERAVATCGRDPDACRALSERVGTLDARATRASAEVQARISALADLIDGAWFEALVARGTAADVAASEAAAWLVQAVDFGEDRIAQTRGRDATKPWRERLRELLPLFDAAQRRRWTPETMAVVPWEALPLREEEWVTSYGGNMACGVASGVLRLTCAADERNRAGAVILRGRDWHAASIACDVRLEQGTAVMLPRVHKRFVNRNGGGIELTTAPTAAPAKDVTVVPAGQAIHVEATVVGDRVLATVGLPGTTIVELGIGTDERRGSLGLILRAGTVVAISDVRVRRLD